MAKILKAPSSSSSSSISIFLILVLLISVNVVQGKRRPALFVFGDSFHDTGNNNFLPTATSFANIPPFGVTYFNIPTGRFSDGRVIPDFIAKCAHLPLPRPYLQPGPVSYITGSNFASSGSGALDETAQGTVISLNAQVDYYKKVALVLRKKYGHGDSKAIISRAVYLFNVGINDYLYPLAINPTSLTPQYAGLVVGNITMAIEELYKLGGRKFAINNVGPLGCFPGVKAVMPATNETCVSQASQFAILHNQLLSQALSEVAKRHKDFKYGLFDMFKHLEKRVVDPNAYGMKEGVTACCGSGPFRGIFSCGGQENLTSYELCSKPKEYVFWDAVHTSDMANKEVASLIWAGGPESIGPYNVKTLFKLP